MNTITIKAFAKINLGLEILSKREDGYHDINTAISRISLADTLYFSKNKKILLNSPLQLDIQPEQNLVYKAALLMKDELSVNEGVEITLIKNIPIGAGLGGGSSDAASTISGLMKLWNIADTEITLEKVTAIAKQLGSDVPYFLNGGSAIARSRGDILEPFDSGLKFHVLIVMPDISVSTKWAYENLKETCFSKNETDLKSTLIEASLNKSILKEKVFNNFEHLIFEHYPEIGKIKEKPYESDAEFALMSGSGASVYGLFNTKDKAQSASMKFSEYKCFVCEMI